MFPVFKLNLPKPDPPLSACNLIPLIQFTFNIFLYLLFPSLCFLIRSFLAVRLEIFDDNYIKSKSLIWIRSAELKLGVTSKLKCWPLQTFAIIFNRGKGF